MVYRIEAVPIVIKGRTGYDIKVRDPQATVQDYVDALNRFIEEIPCFRTRTPERETCYSCDLCCKERIPVTLIDVYSLAGNRNIQEVIRNSLHVYVQDRVVDITMRLNESGCCIYLDSAKGICSNYMNRPLVCQTFICCPATIAAQQLREEVVNTGEDELVRSWFKVGQETGTFLINEAVNPDLDPEDYPATPFQAKTSYGQVRLKDVCTGELWQQIAGS
jgi:Fe-S-cluster containining protein